jgi:Na+/pantothenate symporter
MSIRVSPISRTAAIVIIALGLFTLAGGVLAGALADEIAGVVFIILGVALYRLLYVITGKVLGEVEKADEAQEMEG